MKIEQALIIKKKWIDKIFDEGKIWEMRSQPTNIRGRIGLIESGTGHIVDEVDLTGCEEIDTKDKDLIKYHKVENVDLLDKWSYAWFLENAKRYSKPVPYTHPQGAVIWVKI